MLRIESRGSELHIMEDSRVGSVAFGPMSPTELNSDTTSVSSKVDLYLWGDWAPCDHVTLTGVLREI